MAKKITMNITKFNNTSAKLDMLNYNYHMLKTRSYFTDKLFRRVWAANNVCRTCYCFFINCCLLLFFPSVDT